MRVGLAIRVFFRIIWHSEFACRVESLVRALPEESAAPGPAVESARPRESVAARSAPRSEAITLLAALQREARFVDLVMEPLGGYSDAQVGAAARDVLRECGQVLERLFGICPLVDHQEGTEVEVPAGYDAGRYRLTGNVGGRPPFRGRVAHHGWLATRCQLPTWSGSEGGRMIIAPQEVELS